MVATLEHRAWGSLIQKLEGLAWPSDSLCLTQGVLPYWSICEVWQNRLGLRCGFLLWRCYQVIWLIVNHNIHIYIYMSDMMYINVYPMISMIDLHKMVEVHPLYMASSLLDLDVLGGLGHLDPRVSPMRHDLPGLVMTNFWNTRPGLIWFNMVMMGWFAGIMMGSYWDIDGYTLW